jgi:C-1 hydroxylase
VTEANKALLRRYIELYNERAWDELKELLTADYVHHSNADELTADQFVRGSEWIIARIPDFRVEILDLVAEDDRVAVRFVGKGTHAASMFGEPPSSRAVAWLGTTVFTIVDGRIVEDWEVMDEGDLRRQIGAPAG